MAINDRTDCPTLIDWTVSLKSLNPERRNLSNKWKSWVCFNTKEKLAKHISEKWKKSQIFVMLQLNDSYCTGIKSLLGPVRQLAHCLKLSQVYQKQETPVVSSLQCKLAQMPWILRWSPFENHLERQSTQHYLYWSIIAARWPNSDGKIKRDMASPMTLALALMESPDRQQPTRLD